jgi:hypothetical protein
MVTGRSRGSRRHVLAERRLITRTHQSRPPHLSPSTSLPDITIVSSRLRLTKGRRFRSLGIPAWQSLELYRH